MQESTAEMGGSTHSRNRPKQSLECALIHDETEYACPSPTLLSLLQTIVRPLHLIWLA